jgi:tryptophan synthase beta subunit
MYYISFCQQRITKSVSLSFSTLSLSLSILRPTKQRENTQSNVGHAHENRPYPLLVRSEQERMIDEQLRKKICEQEEKKRTQQTPDI